MELLMENNLFSAGTKTCRELSKKKLLIEVLADNNFCVCLNYATNTPFCSKPSAGIVYL